MLPTSSDRDIPNNICLASIACLYCFYKVEFYYFRESDFISRLIKEDREKESNKAEKRKAEKRKNRLKKNLLHHIRKRHQEQKNCSEEFEEFLVDYVNKHAENFFLSNSN